MKLNLTCGACPEQYELLDDDGVVIGSFRLRHGTFHARLQPSDEIVYLTRELRSDGIFEGDERREHMIPAINAVLEGRGLNHSGLAEELLGAY